MQKWLNPSFSNDLLQILAAELPQQNRLIQAEPTNPKLYVRRGMTHFKLGNIAESIADFDQAEQFDPQLRPYLWQRGLSYYYAEQFAAGAEQFQIDLTVNARDVEETVWRYLCMAQLENADAARKALLPVRNDPRAVMRLIYELFAGSTTPEQVLETGAQQGKQGKFYSLLYVGLYYEAARDVELAKLHICDAAQTFQMEYRTDDYMGYLAMVHQKLRGW